MKPASHTEFLTSPNSTTDDIAIRTDTVNGGGANNDSLFLSDYANLTSAGDNSDASIQRSVDLAGATSATLSFRYRSAMDQADDQVLVQVYDNENTEWDTLLTLDNANVNASYAALGSPLDISAYAAYDTTLSVNTQIRFVATGTMEEADFAYIDDVVIAYTVPVNPIFVEDGGPVLLNATASVSDLELDAGDDYNGATLTFARQGGASAEDLFSGTGLLSLAAGDVIYNAVTVGSYTQSGGTLVIAFNGSATSAVADGVLQSVAYENTSDNPPPSVTIDIGFSDGNAGAQGSGGALSATGSVTVNITPTNDAPTGADDKIYVSDNTSVVLPWSIFLGNDTDPESGSLSIVGATESNGVMSALAFAGGNISFATGDVASTQTVSFTYTPSDGTASGAPTTVTVVVLDTSNTSGGVATTYTVPSDSSGSYLDVLGLNDNLTGADTPDVFLGGSGDDTLDGAGGDDVLNGGAGSDTLTGGGGTDIFVFDQISSLSTITDFNPGAGGDVIRLDLSALGTIIDGGGGAVGENDPISVEFVTNVGTQTLDSNDNIFIVTSGTYANTTAGKSSLFAFHDSGSTNEIQFNSGLGDGEDIVILWSDGTNAYLGVWNIDEDSGTSNEIENGFGNTNSITTIGIIQGVDLAGLGTFTAANFDFIA